MVALRGRYPGMTVAHLYDHPRLGSLAGFLDEMAADQPEPVAVTPRRVAPTPLSAQAVATAWSNSLAAM